MTTTLPAWRRRVEAVREAAGVPVFVGGAVVTREWAEARIGTPGYVMSCGRAAGCVDDVGERESRDRRRGTGEVSSA